MSAVYTLILRLESRLYLHTWDWMHVCEAWRGSWQSTIFFVPRDLRKMETQCSSALISWAGCPKLGVYVFINYAKGVKNLTLFSSWAQHDIYGEGSNPLIEGIMDWFFYCYCGSVGKFRDNACCAQQHISLRFFFSKHTGHGLSSSGTSNNRKIWWKLLKPSTSLGHA